MTTDYTVDRFYTIPKCTLSQFDYTETQEGVPMIFVSFEENVGYYIIYTQQELADFFIKYQKVLYQRKFFDFAEIVRKKLPRIRPKKHSRNYNRSIEIQLVL